MKRILAFFTIVATASMLVLIGCTEGAVETGAVTLSITDAPLEDDALTGVWITITGVEFHTAEGGWQTYEGSLPEEPVNLMLLSGGETEQLGTEVALPSGRYTQIRFLLDIAETTDGVPTNPGCYLTFDDDGDPETADVEYGLFVPSGDTSGYKAVKAFTVPVNGSISLTADFDLRKAVIDAGTPLASHYILKPTIRLVVDGEAGWIHGAVVPQDIPAGAASVVAYAYADGSWTDSEDDEPLEDTGVRFGGAVTSAAVCTDGDTGEMSYKLAFLAAGLYDVAVATFDVDGNFLQMWGFYNNADVIEGAGTTVELSAASLTATLE